MNWKIYIAPRCKKQIRALRKADRKGGAAAERAEEIIFRLTAGDNPYAMKNRLTKNGEQRLDHALKYNLGAGYRMICLKRKNKLFVLYVGAHDECDRFLTTHRGAKVQVTNTKPVSVPDIKHYRRNDLPTITSSPQPEKDPYEERLLAKLDDKTLRRIFHRFRVG